MDDHQAHTIEIDVSKTSHRHVDGYRIRPRRRGQPRAGDSTLIISGDDQHLRIWRPLQIGDGTSAKLSHRQVHAAQVRNEGAVVVIAAAVMRNLLLLAGAPFSNKNIVFTNVSLVA